MKHSVGLLNFQSYKHEAMIPKNMKKIKLHYDVVWKDILQQCRLQGDIRLIASAGLNPTRFSKYSELGLSDSQESKYKIFTVITTGILFTAAIRHSAGDW